MESTHTASLDIPELSEAASVAHGVSDMARNSLLSVFQLCKKGYFVTFRIDGFTLYNYSSKAILKGHRDLGAGFWRIKLCSDKTQAQNS
jgi:hypothetical protein